MRDAVRFLLSVTVGILGALLAALLLFPIPSHAAFPAEPVGSYTCSNNGFTGPVRDSEAAACLAWAQSYPGWIGYFSGWAVTGCNGGTCDLSMVDPNGVGNTALGFALGTVTGYTCPANASVTGSSCECVSGFTESGTACVSAAAFPSSISLAPFDIPLNEAGDIALAIMLLWGVAFGIRMAIRVIKDSDSGGSDPDS